MNTPNRETRIGSAVFSTALALLCMLFCVYPATPQTLTTGQVQGRIGDQSGAVVPNAKIELRDTATGALRAATSDAGGQYTFAQVTPGAYSVTVTAKGFAQAVVPSVTVEVGKTSTINLSLKLGEVTERVEVNTTPGAELQTLDATVGNTVGGNEILALPTLERNTTSLLLLQPLALPQQSTSTQQSSRFGGQVAGARSDQNSFLLDGGEITNPTSGNSDYYRAFSGGPEGSIPTPVESIQEFNVETNNPSGSLNVGGGAQVVLVSKRGGDHFHGSLYEFYRGAALNANRWDANRVGRARPNVVDNRFGASVGGHLLPGAWKSYFYTNYEGRRRSEASFITRLVPSATLRQGILQFRNSAGTVISYPLKPGNIANLCGSLGTGSCEAPAPRNFGMSPAVKSLWQLEPAGNDPTQGDGLNTTGFSAFGKFPVNDNFGLVRVDHDFGSRLHWTAAYRHFTTDAGFLRQVDIGGLLPGDVSGVPKVLSSIPRQPRYFVTGLTANITPNVTNDIHFSWLRDWWQWISLPPFPQVPGISAALASGGDTLNALVPVNIDTQNARTRLWNSHGIGLRDDASWLMGKHLLRFGGSFNHTWAYFQRDDGQQNSQKTLQYFTGTTIGGVNIGAAFRPPMCAAGAPANCLPSNQNSNWNNLYAQVLGLVDAASILRARDAQLQLLPPGTDLKNTVRYNQATLYIQDTWRWRPTLTLTYGLAWAATVPPVEDKGQFMMTVDPKSGRIVLPRTYLEQRRQAALAGQVFNPPVGFTPIGKTGRKYPFPFVVENFEPRIAVAWQPTFDSGLRGRLFGNGKTVLRGGYWHYYDRLNGVQTVIDPLQAVGFGQSLLCLAPTISATCPGSGGSDPTNAFRVGVDPGNVAFPPIATSITPPVVPSNAPGSIVPFVPNSQVQDPQWRPGSHDTWDVTIQRELPGQSRVEIGYVGHLARHIYQGIDLNQVPFFMTAGGQSFAQAFDALAADPNLTKLQTTSPVARQPFFETILSGSICSPTCTAGVASKFASDIANQRVRNVFNGIQSSFRTEPATNAATQFTNFFYWSSIARSNYNAGFVSYRVRAYQGLTLDANFTYAHSVDNVGVNQDTDQAFTNSYDPHYDYGTSLFDRKFVFTMLGVWEVPFHSKNSWLKQITDGWQVAPILSVASGLPLRVLDGSSQEFGQTSIGTPASEAIRIGSGGTDAGRNNVTPASGQCGSSGSLNIFANPQAVCSEFRPILLSVDKTSRGGTLRGFGLWNLDLSFRKKFMFKEQTGITFSAEFFNIFNHVNFLDPAASLQSPQTFGVITTQGNDPRQVQLGLRFDF